MSPFDALSDFVLGWMKRTATAAWLKFLFELGFTMVVSFLVICGSTLMSTENTALSIGAGMITAGVSMTVLFRRETSKLTKGMLVVLPELEAEKEINTDLQTIQKKD